MENNNQLLDNIRKEILQYLGNSKETSEVKIQVLLSALCSSLSMVIMGLGMEDSKRKFFLKHLADNIDRAIKEASEEINHLTNKK